jgi:hypothetical protein
MYIPAVMSAVHDGQTTTVMQGSVLDGWIDPAHQSALPTVTHIFPPTMNVMAPNQGLSLTAWRTAGRPNTDASGGMTKLVIAAIVSPWSVSNWTE